MKTDKKQSGKIIKIKREREREDRKMEPSFNRTLISKTKKKKKNKTK